jgi:hypothetical protein
MGTFIQDQLAQHGHSMSLQEKARLLTIQQVTDERIGAAVELIQRARSLNGAYGADAILQDAIIALETLTASDGITEKRCPKL